jgi:hypothetical protein
VVVTTSVAGAESLTDRDRMALVGNTGGRMSGGIGNPRPKRDTTHPRRYLVTVFRTLPTRRNTLR